MYYPPFFLVICEIKNDVTLITDCARVKKPCTITNKINLKFYGAVDVNKCLEQINFPISLPRTRNLFLTASQYQYHGLTSPHTTCPRSVGPINIVTYCIKWGKTSWTYSIV